MNLRQKIRPAIAVRALLFSVITLTLLHYASLRTRWQFVEWQMIYYFLWIGLTGAIVLTNKQNWTSTLILTLPGLAFLYVLWMRAITFVLPDNRSFFILPVMAILYWLTIWGLAKTNRVRSWWRAELYTIRIAAGLISFSLFYGPVVASRPSFVSLSGLVLAAGLVCAFPHFRRRLARKSTRRRATGALILSSLAIFTVFWYPWRSEDKFKYPAWYYGRYLTARPFLTRWSGRLGLVNKPRILLTLFRKWSVELDYPWWKPNSKLSPLIERALLGRLESFGHKKSNTTWGDDALWVAMVGNKGSRGLRDPFLLWRYGVGKAEGERRVHIESWTSDTFGHPPSLAPTLTIPELLYWYALHCKNRGEEEKAILLCQKALQEAKTPWWLSPTTTIAEVYREMGDAERAIALLDDLLRRIPAPQYEGDIDHMRPIAATLSHLYREQGDTLREAVFRTCYRRYGRGDVTPGFSAYAKTAVREASRQLFLLMRNHMDDPEVFLWEMADPAYRYPAPLTRLSPYELDQAPPKLIEFTKPVYPHDPKGVGSPVVTLRAFIDVEGKVREVEVLKSAGEACDEAALQAVRQAEFSPARMEGRPAEAWIKFPVRFRHPRMKGPTLLPAGTIESATRQYPPEPISLPEFTVYDTPPEIVEWVEPVYPETLRGGCIFEPWVILKVLVNEGGEVEEAVVLKSLSEPCDSAAVNAIKEAQFSPARLKGKAVKAWIKFPVMFRVPVLEM